MPGAGKAAGGMPGRCSCGCSPAGTQACAFAAHSAHVLHPLPTAPHSTSINSYQCKDCGTTVCLKHRLASDHQCPGRAASAARAAQGRLGLGSSIRRMFGSNGSSAAAAGAVAGHARSQKQQQQQQPARPQQRQQPAPAAAGNGSTRAGVGQRAAAAAGRAANSVQAQLQQYRQRQQQRTGGGSASSSTADVIDPTGAAGPAPVAAGPEVCAQCGARFADVAALIAHAEATHSSGWASGQIAQQRQQQGAGGGGGGGGLERCPHCGRGFSDAVQLVAHVEQQHGGGSSSCVLS